MADLKEALYELKHETSCRTPLRVFNGNIWAPVSLRKTFECANCGRGLFFKDEAWKPMGGPGMKSRRYCCNCAVWMHKVEALQPLVHSKSKHAKAALKAIRRYLDLLTQVKGGGR